MKPLFFRWFHTFKLKKNNCRIEIPESEIATLGTVILSKDFTKIVSVELLFCFGIEKKKSIFVVSLISEILSKFYGDKKNWSHFGSDIE